MTFLNERKLFLWSCSCFAEKQKKTYLQIKRQYILMLNQYMINLQQYEMKADNLQKEAESLWDNRQYDDSVAKLQSSISLYKFLFERKGNIFAERHKAYFQRYSALLVSRRSQIQQIKKKYPKGALVNAPIPKKKAGGGGGGSGGSSSQESQEMKGAMEGCLVGQKPNIKWSDVSGLQVAKNALKQAVIYPIKFPNFFDDIVKPWRGILLYGPPGTGKTFLAKACATQAQAKFFSVSSSDLISKYVGQSQRLIKALFQTARQNKPSIIFIDQIDSMCGQRTDGQNDSSKRVITQFLVQMQGVGMDNNNVLVLGATNIPWSLDPAIRRRFQKRIYIPLPQFQARFGILKNGISKLKSHCISEDQIKKLAHQSENYSGSDLSILIKTAAYIPLKKAQHANYWKKGPNGKYQVAEQDKAGAIKKTLMDFGKDQVELPIVSFKDFMESMKSCKPSVDHTQLTRYQKFTTEFGEDG